MFTVLKKTNKKKVIEKRIIDIVVLSKDSVALELPKFDLPHSQLQLLIHSYVSD